MIIYDRFAVTEIGELIEKLFPRSYVAYQTTRQGRKWGYILVMAPTPSHRVKGIYRELTDEEWALVKLAL